MLTIAVLCQFRDEALLVVIPRCLANIRSMKPSGPDDLIHHSLKDMMALTISFSFCMRALAAFRRETLACVCTSSISLE